MNWFGTSPGEGFEHHLLGIGLSASIIVRGSGAWSVDRLIAACGHLVRRAEA